jgi:uncharacterized protein YcnI
VPRSRRIRVLAAALAAAGAAAVLAAPAGAHIQVTPAEAAPGDPVEFTLRVPGETGARTVEVSLQMPAEVLPFAYGDPPGWRRTLEQAPDGSVRVVRWRGEMAPDGFVEFSFRASTPEQPGTLTWKAVQRYSDGEEAAWIGPPDSDNPAATTVGSAGAARQNAGGEGAAAAAGGGSTAAAATPAADAGDDDGDDDGSGSTVAIVLGIAGCLLGGAALAVALSRRRA